MRVLNLNEQTSPDEEWKQNMVLSALVARAGGQVTVSFAELVALKQKKLYAREGYDHVTIVLR